MSGTQTELPLGESITADSDPSSEQPPMPESPPSELVSKPLPPVDGREEIAPDRDISVKTGDLVVSYVGADEMEWYGFLPVAVYGLSTIIGISLPSYQYGDRELEKTVESYSTYLDEPHTHVYRDVAPTTEAGEESA